MGRIIPYIIVLVGYHFHRNPCSRYHVVTNGHRDLPTAKPSPSTQQGQVIVGAFTKLGAMLFWIHHFWTKPSCICWLCSDLQFAIENGPVEIVDLPIENGEFPHYPYILVGG